MNNKISLYIRSTGWAVIWVIMFPDLLMFSSWPDKPGQVVSLLMQYLLSGLLLEYSYRIIVWGGWLSHKQDTFSLNPSWPENIWIEFSNRYPEHSGTVNVLCADGKQRTGRVAEREDGRKAIVLTLTLEEAKLSEEKIWNFRPTHWCETEKEEKL